MPDATYIKKSSARNIIVGIFLFFMLSLGGGLQIVKQQARNYAVAQAVSINNRTTCAFRSLVDPIISSSERTFKESTKTANDPTVNDRTRARAAAVAKSAQKSLDGLTKFRAVYNTVPPGYKCPVTHG